MTWTAQLLKAGEARALVEAQLAIEMVAGRRQLEQEEQEDTLEGVW